MRSDKLVRQVFVALAAAFLALIIAASWTPGHQPHATSQTFHGMNGPRDLFRAHNLRDIVTNVLLYVPLGVFIALSRRRPRLFSAWILVGLAVSVVMEVGQMFIGRFAAMVDVVTNTMGYVAGFGIVVVATRAYGLDPAALFGVEERATSDSRTRTFAALRFIYVSIYALIAVLPLDVTVNLTEVYAQLFPKAGDAPRIILDPFYSFSHWGDRGLNLTFELLGLIPVAALTAFVDAARRRMNLFSPILSAVLLAAFSESVQLFLRSRTSDIALIPTAAFAGIIGWGLARVWLMVQGNDATASDNVTSRWRQLLAALAGYGAVLLMFAWSPFHFETDPIVVARKVLHESNLIPFKEHFGTRDLGSAVDIVKEFGQYLPFGLLAAALVTEVRPRLRRRNVVLIAGLISISAAVFLELSQAVSVGRYIDVTDVLLGGVGGVTGAVMLHLFWFRQNTPTDEPPAVDW